MTDDSPVLKHRPADFLVRENLLVPLTQEGDASYRYLLLRKSGYTTFEALALLAEHLDCPVQQVTYSGLKDEDGITEQLVAVPLAAGGALPGDGCARLSGPGDPRTLSVLHYGYGAEPLEVGRLEGNSFRIVVRNLAPTVAERLRSMRKISFYALNYYDTQRFGVPGGPKLTHVLGGQVLKGDWGAAFSTLLQLQAPETSLARDWDGSPEEFFRHKLDTRVVNFYLSAWASHEWNQTLALIVSDAAAGASYVQTVDGIDFRYLEHADATAQVLNMCPSLPYRRHSFDPRVPETSSRRATAVQIQIITEAVQEDEFHPGRSSAAVRFALPSGCYATSVLRQLLTPMTALCQVA
ncbi:tRNA pseudouridine(13) synthase TruD [Streptomyces sp. NBC_01465]|uniref:tRNA pseudouridine(13) synthase TruD n=1 Tax=Streptomyces sp. NBC_01465 TaxID=2903878 RepID=UPI002E327756|nr:tRNA pseudouridine(13) synthase TruD [Streptomyces sp. NBC_01465]